MSLEQIVRPFQKPVSIATRRIVSVNQNVTSQDAIIAWGQAGAMPSPTQEQPGQTGFKIENCNETFHEKNRTTHDQTITDGASGASVTFTITDKITFSKSNLDAVNVGSLRTETTVYSVPDPFATTQFGDVSKSNICESSYALNNANTQ